MLGTDLRAVVFMPTAPAKRPSHRDVPETGTYVTDADRTNLYRIEALHRKEGVVLEDCRTTDCFMLSIQEYRHAGYLELG